MIRSFFHPEAGRELEEAALFYESRVPGLVSLSQRRWSGRFGLFKSTLMLARHRVLSVAKLWLTGFLTPSRTNVMKILLSSWQLLIRSDARVTGAIAISALTTASKTTRLRRASEPFC